MAFLASACVNCWSDIRNFDCWWEDETWRKAKHFALNFEALPPVKRFGLTAMR